MFISEKGNYIELSVYIQPRSSKNEVTGMFDNKIKIRLTSPPVEGAANELLIKFLSKILAIAKTNISILSGEKSRNKLLMIKGISESQARECLKISN